MFGKQRDGAPAFGALESTRRRLWATSSLLTCGVLVIALVAAWGFSVNTSYRSDATLLYDILLSEQPDPAALQGGHATSADALAAYEWAARGEYLPTSSARDIRAWDGLSGFHDAFVAVYAPDGSVTLLHRPPRVTTGEDSDFTDDEAAEAIDRANSAFNAGATRFWWERLVELDGRTFLWDTIVTCVNPAYDPATGENAETSWYASGDLQDYVDDGYLAGRSLGLLDVTSSVVALTWLARALALLGVAGCAVLVLVCRGMVTRALEPARVAADRRNAFIVAASHDLKTPLASLSANLDALEAHGARSVESQGRWTGNMRADIDVMAARVCELLNGL